MGEGNSRRLKKWPQEKMKRMIKSENERAKMKVGFIGSRRRCKSESIGIIIANVGVLGVNLQSFEVI